MLPTARRRFRPSRRDAQPQPLHVGIGEPSGLVRAQGAQVRVGELDRGHFVVPCNAVGFTGPTIRSNTTVTQPNVGRLPYFIG